MQHSTPSSGISSTPPPTPPPSEEVRNAPSPGRIEVGTPTGPFVAQPTVTAVGATQYVYRPDSIVDGWTAGPFTVRAASTRGDSHRYRGEPRQDDLALAFHPETTSMVIAVSDGVSNAPLSHLGASAACRYVVDAALRQLDAEATLNWDALFRGAAWTIVQLNQKLRRISEPDPEDAERALACTLTMAWIRSSVDSGEVQAVILGDSGISVLTPAGFGPFIGVKPDPEDGVLSTAVACLPRVPTPLPQNFLRLDRDAVLLVATDGIWDPLGSGRGLLGGLLLEQLTSGLPDPLQLCRLADFSRQTFDDDRTLVAVWMWG